MRMHLNNFAAVLLDRPSPRRAGGARRLRRRGLDRGGGRQAERGRGEDFWGTIAEQVGGDRVAVTDIITNPAADPHDYEPTADDGRALAGAQVSIVNGIGYDEWASKLLAANETARGWKSSVGDVLGLKSGDNPHQWYSPRRSTR